MSRRGMSTGFVGVESRIHLSSRQEHFPNDTYITSSGPIQPEYAQGAESPESQYHINNRNWTEEGSEALPPLRPNRRKGEDIESGSQKLTEYNLSKHNNVAKVNPMVSNYTSPIGQFLCVFFWRLFFFLKLEHCADIASYSSVNEGRLTFARQ